MIGRRLVLRVFAVLAMVCGTFMAPSAQADVIMPPPDGCNQVRDLGKLEIGTDFVPADDETCFDRPAKRLKIRAMTIEWEPENLPLLVMMKRDRGGYQLFLTSMLSDRRYKHVCWFYQQVPPSDATWRSLVRAFDRWASTCSTTLAIGRAEARRGLMARRYDFGHGLAQLAQVPLRRFGPPEEIVGIGSFLPTRITQGLLDAVADACEGPRERLKLLPDGAIAWSFNDRLPSGPDGSRPFDNCVNDQIKYFPGYPKRQ